MSIEAEQKLAKIQQLVQSWIDKQGHEKCWYYPDIFNEIAKIVGVIVNETESVSRKDFEIGCHEFQKSIYGEDQEVVHARLATNKSALGRFLCKDFDTADYFELVNLIQTKEQLSKVLGSITCVVCKQKLEDILKNRSW